MFTIQSLNAIKMADLGYATCKTLITLFWLCSLYLTLLLLKVGLM